MIKNKVRIILKPLKLFAAMARNDDGSYHIVGLMHPDLGHLPVVNSKREVVETCFKMIEQTIREKSKIVEFTSNEDFDVEKD